MKQHLTFFVALLLAPPVTLHAAEAPRKPNILVILADDLGYADLGCQGSREAVTPQIDSLAANGVRCTAGYVTAPQCCPSRAGLITGRYQNRFGFEANWPAALSGKAGLPTSERTIADQLHAAGYVTGLIGKWHLGDAEAMRPYNRGFDETLWHANGGVLFPDKNTGFISKLYRGSEPVQVAEYSTDAFGREAVEFIGRHQREPFFLYLAFVPPHWPMEAKPEHLAQFAHVSDLHRRTLLAMLASLDANVGRVLRKLRETQLEKNTLVFFLSDNGGPTGKPRPRPEAEFEYGQNTSRNDPCRGVKGDLLEGGIRVPFLVQWKGRLPAGRIFDQPVISLDILPTALAASGVEPLPGAKRDGANLLPFLAGEKQGSPHDTLCWRFCFPPAQPARHRWAIRQGDWKLVKNDTAALALYHLADDVGETKNLAAEQPERVHAMQVAWKQWDAENREPLWQEAPSLPSHQAKVEVFPTEIRVQCTGNDPQLILSEIPAGTGPFTLELKVKSTSAGPGELFWATTDAPQFVPGQSVTFQLQHDGQAWREYTVELPATAQPLRHLRFDPGNAPGLVRIARLVLKDAKGKLLKTWIGDAERIQPAAKVG
jgi:arylsulfatase A-like enzyme